MKIYEVGGAVRDLLLGLPVVERDWVVVGATPEQMIAEGYRAVGRDFPVFLHPATGEEYALARTERKSGTGYRGFVVNANPSVSLEEDLGRRDLTINAMARDQDGSLFDPYGGHIDLERRVLRHVSSAFSEDPVRVLRVARFAARLAPLGFVVAPETCELMRQMVAVGEVDHLVPERTWKETARALSGDGRADEKYRPSVFFLTLRACGALARIMPEIEALFGVPQPAKYHPEIDTGDHVMRVVDAAHRMGFDATVRTAALLHDLGKSLTPPALLPGHRGHDQRGVPLVKEFCSRLRVPSGHRDLAMAVAREHINVHRAPRSGPVELLALLERLRAFQDSPFFEQALEACLCDARGRKGFENCEYEPVSFLRIARDVAASVRARDLMGSAPSGPQMGLLLRSKRIEMLGRWLTADEEAR